MHPYREKPTSKRNNVRYFVVVFDSEVTALTFKKSNLHNQKIPKHLCRSFPQS